MKKVFTLAAAALFMTGIAFAHDHDKKKCTKDCCKGGKECKKEDKKSTAKSTAKVAVKKA